MVTVTVFMMTVMVVVMVMFKLGFAVDLGKRSRQTYTLRLSGVILATNLHF